jgi:hypothetical protein
MRSLSELRERHRGPVITPSDRGFDEARATFNGMIERHTELIVRPLDISDVVTALLFAREADLPVAVRGGRNFGVVVDVTFQLHPVGLLLGGSLDYLLEDAPVVLPVWRDVMANAPDSLASFTQVARP